MTLLSRFAAEFGTRRLLVEIVAGPVVVGLVAMVLLGVAVVSNA